MSIDRRLAVLGGNDDRRGRKQTLVLQLLHHLAYGRIDEHDLSLHVRGGRSGSIGVAAFHAIFNQLLANTDRLKIHAEKIGHLTLAAKVALALDLIENRVDLELVVAPDVLEAGGPIAS